jgi:hypothetical protein
LFGSTQARAERTQIDAGIGGNIDASIGGDIRAANGRAWDG